MTVLTSLISPDKKNYLEETLQTRVDVIPARALRDELKTAVLADVKYI
jgi:predicted nucleotidyltransferase